MIKIEQVIIRNLSELVEEACKNCEYKVICESKRLYCLDIIVKAIQAKGR